MGLIILMILEKYFNIITNGSDAPQAKGLFFYPKIQIRKEPTYEEKGKRQIPATLPNRSILR